MGRSILCEVSRFAVLFVLAGGAVGPVEASPPRSHEASLSCRVQAGLIKGAAKVPKTVEFVWGAAQGSDDATGPIRTGLGQIDQGTGSSATAVPTLRGKPLALPAEVAGSVIYGRAVDYGDKVVLAYLVERAEDSSASPSQVVVLLGAKGQVLETDLLPGTAASPGKHCVVVE
jgi:hypothetical protein